MENTKIVSFVGVGRGDIPYYIHRYLNADGKKVLYIDNTSVKDIYNAIPRMEGETVGYQKGTTFVKNIRYSESIAEDYHFILVNHGRKMNEEWIEKSDHIFMISNYEQHYLDEVVEKLNNIREFAPKKFGDEEQDPCIMLVFRDKTNKTKNDTKLMKELGLQDFSFAEKFTLPYDMKDYSAYLELLSNGRQSIAKSDLSQEMLQFLSRSAEKILEKEKRAMKRLERRVAKKMKGGLLG